MRIKMRVNIKAFSLILLILTIIGCQSFNSKKQQLIQKEYGNLDIKKDVLVELELNLFNNWKSLLHRTERIVCTDNLKSL